MRISQLILELSKIQNEYGDIPVIINECSSDNTQVIDQDSLYVATDIRYGNEVQLLIQYE